MNKNAIAFIALCNEYCNAVEMIRDAERESFVRQIIRLLPRIYITANDLQVTGEEAYLNDALSEEAYSQVCRSIATLFGEDDAYLEVFEEDMKYSDTPIVANISEQLSDLYQVFYDFIDTVRDAPDFVADAALSAVCDDFRDNWGLTLCKVMRPLHALTMCQ